MISIYRLCLQIHSNDTDRNGGVLFRMPNLVFHDGAIGNWLSLKSFAFVVICQVWGNDDLNLFVQTHAIQGLFHSRKHVSLSHNDFQRLRVPVLVFGIRINQLTFVVAFVLGWITKPTVLSNRSTS